MPETLTPAERTDLAQHDATIRNGKRVLLEIGRALRDIRDRRLYREAYGSLEFYCRNEYGLERNRVYQLIEYADTVDTIAPTKLGADEAPNEAQARVLAEVPIEIRGDVWEESEATAPVSRNGHSRNSARHIANTAARLTPSVGESLATDDGPDLGYACGEQDEPEEPNTIGAAADRIADCLDREFSALDEDWQKSTLKDRVQEMLEAL